MGTKNPDIPPLKQAQRITGIALKPDFLDLLRRRRRVGIQVDAPALPIEAPQELPAIALDIRKAE
jgi:hypothetical protein